MTEFVEAVVFLDDEFYADLLSVIPQAVTAGFVFNIRMDVGIIPKKSWLDTFGP